MARAQRRHDTRRIKTRHYEYQKTRGFDSETDQRRAGIFANHGKTCSCFMCGNPRRYWGDLSMQEKRAPLPIDFND